MLRKWMRELKIQMEPPGGFNSPPLPDLELNKSVRYFVPFPCGSSRAVSCLSQSLAADTSHFLTVSIFHVRWSRDDGAVESLLWELSWGLYHPGARWWWQSSEIVLHWLWGDSVSCVKRTNDKYYSVFSILLPQLRSGSGFCGYPCAVQGALLLSRWNQSWYSQQRFSSG